MAAKADKAALAIRDLLAHLLRLPLRSDGCLANQVTALCRADSFARLQLAQI